MDTEILKFVGQVAGIGGLALGVVLLVFKETIRKDFLSQLGPRDSYRLLRMIVALSFTIGVLGIGAWVWTETQSTPVTVMFLVIGALGLAAWGWTERTSTPAAASPAFKARRDFTARDVDVDDRSGTGGPVIDVDRDIKGRDFKVKR